MDETYTKVMGTCKYLFREVDYQGNTVLSICFGVSRWSWRIASLSSRALAVESSTSTSSLCMAVR
jgi:hypothetical protein